MSMTQNGIFAHLLSYECLIVVLELRNGIIFDQSKQFAVYRLKRRGSALAARNGQRNKRSDPADDYYIFLNFAYF